MARCLVTRRLHGDALERLRAEHDVEKPVPGALFEEYDSHASALADELTRDLGYGSMAPYSRPSRSYRERGLRACL